MMTKGDARSNERSIHEQTYKEWDGDTLAGLPLIRLENPTHGEVVAAAVKTLHRYVAVRIQGSRPRFILLSDGEVLGQWRIASEGESTDRAAFKLSLAARKAQYKELMAVAAFKALCAQADEEARSRTSASHGGS
jgi:hypothetical protein